MTAITYTVTSSNYNIDDSITINAGDTLLIDHSINEGDYINYGLYKAGASLNYPEGTYPSTYQSSSYWNLIAVDGGLTDGLYSKSAMTLPVGTYTFTKGRFEIMIDASTKGKTLTVVVQAETYKKLTYDSKKIQVESAIRDEDGVKISTNYAKKSELPTNITIQNRAPTSSDGNDGDIWLQY